MNIVEVVTVPKTDTNQPKLLLTPREAAKALSVSEKTLYRLTKAGAIPRVRIGAAVRYSVEDLQAWIRHATEKN